MTQINVKIVGMSLPKSFTCRDENDNTFWAKTTIPEDRFAALFKWAKNDPDFWATGVIGEGECDRVVDGEPINAVIHSIKVN